jgi:hypothetical protein
LHIDELEKLMKEKGYDGSFLCNSNFPGKLRESLQQHLSEMLQEQNHLPPFYLTTYSHWRDEENPYVLCDFKVKYDKWNGFRIEKLEVKRASPFGTIKNYETHLINNEDLPSREKANTLVGQRKWSMKL